jgi:phytoene dehydrogenase-like protein
MFEAADCDSIVPETWKADTQLSKYDSIIIGAGHNGLVCAASLARAGQSVLLLESTGSIGGLAANREFHPGFKTSVAHSVNHFPTAVARKLDLQSHGLALDRGVPPLVGLSPEGKHVVIDGNDLHGVSDEDGTAWLAYGKQMQRFADSLEPFWLKTIPRIGHNNFSDVLTFGHMGLNIRRLGKSDMREFLRVFSLPMRDLMDENFESDTLKSLLSWDGLIGSKMAPRSPNNSVLTLLYRMAGKTTSTSVGALIKALKSSAEAAGVEIRTGATVDRVRIKGDTDGLKATGVHMLDGEVIEAERVISSADPQTTFLNLVGVEHLEIGFTNRIKRLRCKGYVTKLHLALSDLPDLGDIKNPGSRMIMAAEMDTIEFAFDDAKYGQWSDTPVMEIMLPSVSDSSLAPTGQHVLSANVMFVPYDLKGGWDDDARQRLSELIIDRIEHYLPGIRKSILGVELLTPVDLENQFGVTGGHWHHTEMALDQMLMMRPTYEAAQYATPIRGLYLCGAGSHPGGDLTGAPGHNAAQEILK